MNDPSDQLRKEILSKLLDDPNVEIRILQLLAFLLVIEKGELDINDLLVHILLEVRDRKIVFPDELLPDLKDYKIRLADTIFQKFGDLGLPP